jgi:cysteinyl-tRNA synthetase
LISGHYRQPLNFTMNGLHAADDALTKLTKHGGIFARTSEIDAPSCPATWSFLGHAYGALLSDLNVPLCLGTLFKEFGNIDAGGLSHDQKSALARDFFLLKYGVGLRLEEEDISIPGEIQALADARWEAKMQKIMSWRTSCGRKLKRQRGW